MLKMVSSLKNHISNLIIIYFYIIFADVIKVIKKRKRKRKEEYTTYNNYIVRRNINYFDKYGNQVTGFVYFIFDKT